MVIKTDIIPYKQYYFHCAKNILLPKNYDYSHEKLDLENIAFFAATGFFFDDRTYFKNVKTLPSSSIIQIDENNAITSVKRYWDWYYNPVVTELNEATEIFKNVFEKTILTKIAEKKVILPLSGGIDSRTIAAALPDGAENINTYSYEYEGGVKENEYGRQIAKLKKIEFHEFKIRQGYLWNRIDELSQIVHFSADYTHARQMAVIDELEKLGEMFLLGHGGEIFKAPIVDKNLTLERSVDFLYNSIVKKESYEFGEDLWKIWGLKGNFLHFIKDNIAEYLSRIKIDNPNSRIRAFNYKYIASRKNQINVNVFNRKNEIFLPFLTESVINLICNIREDLLIDRKIQIEYIKQKSPELASVPWQNYYPLNLYNYKEYYGLNYFPYRVSYALERKLNQIIRGRPLVERNWEIQLVGEENDTKLKKFLNNFAHKNDLVPQNLIEKYYHKFKFKNKKTYQQPLSLILTLINFQKNRSLIPKKNSSLDDSSQNLNHIPVF